MQPTVRRVSARWIAGGRGKRALDIVVAAPAIVVLSPVIAATWVLTRTKLGPPALFRQLRAGRSGVAIVVPKFRSMTNNIDSSGNLLPDEQRITAFGARLRSTSLDELPQLLSVVRGEMSLVGPRPLPMAYVDRYTPEQRRRLEAKPGITGWAQVNGRNSSSWPDRLAMDVWYVDNASLRLDLRILVLTLKTAIRREGVSADGHVTMREFMGAADDSEVNAERHVDHPID